MKPYLEEIAGEAVIIPAGEVDLEGTLNIPAQCKGIVLFAHGSGSSRFSPRNRFVANCLNENDLGTLLMDLMSPDEEAVDLQTTRLRFDIAFLAERLLHAIRWLHQQLETRNLKVGLFGSSTGGGAALVAAAEEPSLVQTVVSRGGRPDLAAASLAVVMCPTLLIVGGNDTQVIELNRQALNQLACEKQMEVVPRASHLFEEPGALEKVAELAAAWFRLQFSRKDR